MVDPGIPSAQNASAIRSTQILSNAAATLRYGHFPLPLPIPSTEDAERKWEVHQKHEKCNIDCRANAHNCGADTI
jgi:hypothetical protein